MKKKNVFDYDNSKFVVVSNVKFKNLYFAINKEDSNLINSRAKGQRVKALKFEKVDEDYTTKRYRISHNQPYEFKTENLNFETLILDPSVK